jgi:hypothetical protein
MHAIFRLPQRLLLRTASCLGGFAVLLGTAGLVLSAGPALAGPLPWTIQTTANPSGNPISELHGVSCPAATACVAAGDNWTGTKLDALLEVWNGTSWNIPFIKPGDPLLSATGSRLNGASCPSSTKCEAVGFYESGATLPLAVIWNGTLGKFSVSSQPAQVPPGATTALFDGVSCTSATACTAVGYFTDATGMHALIERWNGTSWTIQPAAAGGSALTGVSCTSATACMAVGWSNDGNLAEFWNGQFWRPVLSGTFNGATNSQLYGVSCTSATACVAVGSFAKGSGRFTLGVSWNGSDWTLLNTANLSATVNQLNGVSCTSASNCEAVGQFQDFKGVFHTLAESWSGASWSYEATPDPVGTQPTLNGISCSAAAACTAVGQYKNFSGTILTLAERRI